MTRSCTRTRCPLAIHGPSVPRPFRTPRSLSFRASTPRCEYLEIATGIKGLVVTQERGSLLSYYPLDRPEDDLLCRRR